LRTINDAFIFFSIITDDDKLAGTVKTLQFSFSIGNLPEDVFWAEFCAAMSSLSVLKTLSVCYSRSHKQFLQNLVNYGDLINCLSRTVEKMHVKPLATEDDGEDQVCIFFFAHLYLLNISFSLQTGHGMIPSGDGP
jgi:hypothetical protein